MLGGSHHGRRDLGKSVSIAGRAFPPEPRPLRDRSRQIGLRQRCSLREPSLEKRVQRFGLDAA